MSQIDASAGGTPPTRRLGSLTVSALGLGCMGMSHVYGPADRAEAVATLHRSLDLGLTFLDTADMYGRGPQRGAHRRGAGDAA